MNKNYFKVIILVLAIFMVVFNLFVLSSSIFNTNLFSLNPFTAKANSNLGYVRFCIDKLGYMDSPVDQCGNNFSLRFGESANCSLNYTLNDDDALIFSSEFTSLPTIFQINRTGFFNFTVSQSTEGNHSAIISVTESGDTCSREQISNYEYNFSLIYENTPPEYFRNITDIHLKPYESYLINLYSNFRDVDEDVLAFYSSDHSPILDIEIDETGDVIITAGDYCDPQTVLFIAEDPSLATDVSNPLVNVYIDCTNQDTVESQLSSSSSSGGGGSGGGGGFIRTCEEDWSCLEWSDCYPPDLDRHPDFLSGYKKRDCYDKEACDPDNYEKTIYEDCNYSTKPSCYPNWDCTLWTPCRKDGTEERSCVDKNKCSLEDQIKFGLAETSRLCVYVESCFDKVQNNGELDIDCGGPCEPCKQIVLPSTLQDTNKTLTLFITVLVLLFVIALVIYKLFHKKINQLFSKFIWSIVKKSARQIYLTGSSRQDIISYLVSLEKRVNTITNETNDSEYIKLQDNLFILLRKTFSAMFDIAVESSKAEFIEKINKLDTTEEFRKVLLDLIERFIIMELNGRQIIKSKVDELKLDFNILKLFLFNISDEIDIKNFKPVKINFSKSDNNSNNIIEKILSLLNEAFLKLQNNDKERAKELYMKIIEEYEALDEVEKSNLYELTSILFHILTYINSHLD